MPENKMQPRNRTARLAQVRAAGNPVTTELEAGVGNCFPGLEMDLRNLDRRFFPFLSVDFVGRLIVVASVDVARAEREAAPAALLTGLRRIAGDTPQSWRVTALEGDFAGFGRQTYTVSALGSSAGRPPDAWTAVRLIKPGTSVRITAQRPGGTPVTLSATRASYLTDDGAFAEMFAPGELTQSLCSPWTHDFRDCGCFYWASNHPDVVQPALPPGTDADDPEWAAPALWERAVRVGGPPGPPDPAHGGRLAHMEINARWQELDVVLDGREQRDPYDPGAVAGNPLDPALLEPTLRYAAGVELGVMLEYLSAAYSLRNPAGRPTTDVHRDARAAQSELLRVAASEMRHLRLVNDLLFDLHQSTGAAGDFAPALGITTALPGPSPRPVRFRALTPAVLTEFVDVEKPSLSVDALYSAVLATYQRDGAESHAATVLSIMAEGADHYETFLAVQEWLTRHSGTPYLLTLRVPAAGDPALATLQQRYEQVLGSLHRGYRVRGPAGAADVAAARLAMLGPSGVQGACEDLARAGVLPVFALPTDPRFAAVSPP